ncbi:MAG TPA: carbohydrate-binding protein [Candidatus Angelobacter sp.]|nr:carbohydrate-binding protein [Candidatus Angelobacter sp.]
MKPRSLLVTGICVVLCLVTVTASAQSAPAWQPNTAYSIGQLVTFNGQTFKCIQAHTSQVGWEPPNVPALWQLVSGTPNPTPTPTPAPTPTPTPTPSGGGGGSCAAAWTSTVQYCAGAVVSVGSNNYKAQFCSQGANPTTPGNSGPAGTGDPWFSPVSCSGGGGGGTPTPTPTPPGPTPTPLPPGARLFAPYNDQSLTASGQGVVANAKSAGLKGITLAFLVNSGGGCNFGWGGLGGTLPTDNLSNGTSMQTIVQQLQANGTQVIISFGGALGSITGQCTSASGLQTSLQGVINRYNVKMLDFDMEASDTLGDGPGLPPLIQALKAIKAANSGVVVSFTLPVLPSGLINTGLAVLNEAKKDGFNPDVINVMGMDYGCSQDGSAPSCTGPNMGQDGVNAAIATHNQVVSAGLSSNIGLTVMIGINDTNTEIFKLADTNTVLNFANANSFMTRLSFWSFGRDNGGCPNNGSASATCSGISQNNFQFSQSFESFK